MTHTQVKAEASAQPIQAGGLVGQWTRDHSRTIVAAVSVAIVLFLSLYHLTEYPTTWFDEGSHLHVPKTLVRFGVYADYSSEGFRYYGPTIGIGPTVTVPVAAAFKLFGFGLLQARLVIVFYLLGTLMAFFWFVRGLGGSRLAWVTVGLAFASRGAALLEYGRQMLGEVPGLFFMLAGLQAWFTAWEGAGWRRLGVAGLLLGLAMITKQQYLLVLAPTLLAAWVLNLVYYRTAPQRVFLVPGSVAAACFGLWQIYQIVYLGPATTVENLAQFREFTAGAALVFSPDLMKRGLTELLSLKVYLGLLAPALIYGVSLALPRRREGHQWGILWVLVLWNLAWYVVASISWLRYASPALAVASLFVARFFHDLTEGFEWEGTGLWQALRRRISPSGEEELSLPKWAVRGTLLLWLAVMIALPLGQTAWQIVFPPFNAPAAMAAYLDDNVPREALIETWEPEMGFFTDHNYHFPPHRLLATAVAHIWRGGPSPAQEYDFVQTASPDYVLVGPFARWVELYPTEALTTRYRMVTRVGGYELYTLDD